MESNLLVTGSSVVVAASEVVVVAASEVVAVAASLVETMGVLVAASVWMEVATEVVGAEEAVGWSTGLGMGVDTTATIF